jgi:transmembrane sensor
MATSSKLQAIEETAARWLLKKESNDWTALDQVELDRWLEASPSHQVSFMRLLSVCRNLDRLESIAAGLPRNAVPPPGALERSLFSTHPLTLSLGYPGDPARELSEDTHAQPQEPPRNAHPFNWRRLGTGVAAVATSLLVVTFLALTFLRDIGTRARYITATGGLATVPLQEGSVITLNTDSEIEVRLTNSERHIRLIRGEAFFEVRSNPRRPFIVEANHQRVVVLGTKFSIRLKSRALHIAVTEGAVGLDNVRPLTAGTIAEVQDRQIRLQLGQIDEIKRSLSWRSGFIELVKAPLPEAIAEWNRYFATPFVIGDPALESRRITSRLQTSEIDSVVRFLEISGICMKPVDGRRILTECSNSRPDVPNPRSAVP